MDEDAELHRRAKSLGLEPVLLHGLTLPRRLIEMVPAYIAHAYRIVPVRLEDDILVVATADAGNLAALADLSFLLRVASVRPALITQRGLEEALATYYGKER